LSRACDELALPEDGCNGTNAIRNDWLGPDGYRMFQCDIATQQEGRFREAFKNFNRIINWQLFLNFFQYVYSSVTLVMPGLILAPQFLSGRIEVGRVV
jgi:hypothetical protein